MKISQLVEYLNQLEDIDFSEVNVQARRDIAAINYIVASQETNVGFYKARIQKRYDDVVDSLNQFERVFRNLKEELAQVIQNNEADYYKSSRQLYEAAVAQDTNEHILNRRLGIDDENNLILRSRLRNYTDWRVPGLIIHPGHESFIEDMVPLDPLYVMDVNMDLVTTAVNKFNEQYRARLRTYVVDETRKVMLNELPQQQFGCVFVYNFFNYRPLELVQRYVAELYDCLRPGGTLIFTYNDCDRAHGVKLFEKRFMCYTPGSRLREHAESVGFDVVHHHIGSGDLAWIELRKPGEITSRRGGQTLAQIIRK